MSPCRTKGRIVGEWVGLRFGVSDETAVAMAVLASAVVVVMMLMVVGMRGLAGFGLAAGVDACICLQLLDTSCVELP